MKTIHALLVLICACLASCEKTKTDNRAEAAARQELALMIAEAKGFGCDVTVADDSRARLEQQRREMAEKISQWRLRNGGHPNDEVAREVRASLAVNAHFIERAGNDVMAEIASRQLVETRKKLDDLLLILVGKTE